MTEKFLPLIESEIRRQRLGTAPRSLYDPIRYIMSLGGKRLRPLLTMLAYALYKSDPEKIARYAAAVEAFHNFTLMHDDIMDKAPLRRGKATVHEKWNVNTAILSGDVMLVKVYDVFLELQVGKLKEVLPLFNTCAAEVCEGQQWDMEFETKSRVTEAQYLEMIRLKTAVLLGFSLELGAVLADAPAADRPILRMAGINLGIGFQLKDDLLDVFADQKKFGKQVGGDILANKKTYLLIKAMEKSKGRELAELKRWISAKKFDPRKKVAAVKTMYSNLGIKELTEQKIQSCFVKAFEGINQLSVRGKTEALVRYAHDLMDRQK
ncbi:MAG TPA: polyprenyl synthetase family protein [Cyclobacteriaceae bacterium]|nr:polyprenyl synthetase family protein [Cyclobacteriaceae bacterium]